MKTLANVNSVLPSIAAKMLNLGQLSLVEKGLI